MAIDLTWSKGLCPQKTFYLRPTWDPDFVHLALFSAGVISTETLLWQVIDWLSKGKITEWMEWFSQTDAPETFLGRVFLFAVVVAISEELLFRGFFVTAFYQWGPAWAVIFSSIIFAVLHQPAVMPGAFVIGVVAALAVLRYDSLVPAVLIHAAGNLLPQLVGKYHDLVKASWAEIICVGGRLAVVVVVFVFRHRLAWLWHEFRSLWQEFTEKPKSGARFSELIRQWPWVLLSVILGIQLIFMLLVPFIEP